MPQRSDVRWADMVDDDEAMGESDVPVSVVCVVRHSYAPPQRIAGGARTVACSSF